MRSPRSTWWLQMVESANRDKFPANLILVYSPHLKYVAALHWAVYHFSLHHYAAFSIFLCCLRGYVPHSWWRQWMILPRLASQFLGGVALVAQRPIVVKLSRKRSVGPYVGTYVRASVSLSSALWKNGGSDPDGVWHHRSDGSRDEADSGVWGAVHGKGIFRGEFGVRHCNQWGLYGVRVRQPRDAALFPNYFGQTCFHVFRHLLQ